MVCPLPTGAGCSPVVPLVANVRAEAVSDPDLIRALLIEQVTGSVRWRESVMWMAGAGVTEIWEVGAGKALSGMMAPTLKEKLLGYAEIREVFSITKVGKIAGCMVTEGMVKRGAKVRLVRDDVVIHEGDLSQLKRFKDDAREVKEGFECGMAFANYQDIQVGDKIECFEIEQIAREL